MKEMQRLMSVMVTRIDELGRFFCLDGTIFVKFEILKLLSYFSPDISSMDSICKSDPNLFS